MSGIKIHNFFSYSWLNETIILIPRNLRRILPEDLTRAHLVNSLSQNLYANFYCKGYITSTKTMATRINLPTSKAYYLKQLSASNKGEGYIDDGWSIISSESDKVTVVKNGLKLVLNDTEYVSPQRNPGTNGFQCMPKEHYYLSPGFFMAFGNTDLQLIDDCSIIRFYWNLSSHGAVPLMSAITTTLNNAGLPFRFKILDSPDQFNRCDSAVLYCYKKDYELLSNQVENIHSVILPYLKNETPVFTKPLAWGLGLAENPDQGTSFGVHRCQILSEAIVNAHYQNKKTIDKRLNIVQQHFEEKQISLERPYLNPGSSDIYYFLSDKFSKIHSVQKKEEQHSKPDSQTLIQTAFNIGALLSSKAYWYKDRCNWMDLTPKKTSYENEESLNLTYNALGPDLYSGTSGVALFLAELYSATGDSSMRSLSLGAIRQSLSTIDQIPADLSLGLFNGLIGVAFASAYIGKLLGEEQLIKSASQTLNTALLQTRQMKFLDQIAGNAGAINALLILKDLIDDDNLLTFAKKLGDELTEKTTCHENYCSWKSPSFPKQQNLLGYSHGASGIACALIKLFDATGDLNFRKIAESAMNYEYHWYNKKKNNWPDFRGVKSSKKIDTNTLKFPISWCHGAAGISLTRILAYKILKDDKYKSEALTALNITGDWTTEMLKGEQINFCLCHGLSGNADILLSGYEAMGKEFSRGNELAFDVASAGIALYSQQNRWPFDVFGNNASSLMQGLSGAGLFYLRIQNPKIPSLLAFDQEKILQRLNTVNANIC